VILIFQFSDKDFSAILPWFCSDFAPILQRFCGDSLSATHKKTSNRLLVFWVDAGLHG